MHATRPWHVSIADPMPPFTSNSSDVSVDISPQIVQIPDHIVFATLHMLEDDSIPPFPDISLAMSNPKVASPAACSSVPSITSSELQSLCTSGIYPSWRIVLAYPCRTLSGIAQFLETYTGIGQHAWI